MLSRPPGIPGSLVLRRYSMATQRTHRFLAALVRLIFGIVTAAAVIHAPVTAQETKQANKPDGVFDVEKKADTAKSDTAKPKDGAPNDRDTIGFSQQNVAAQMNEL